MPVGMRTRLTVELRSPLRRRSLLLSGPETRTSVAGLKKWGTVTMLAVVEQAAVVLGSRPMCHRSVDPLLPRMSLPGMNLLGMRPQVRPSHVMCRPRPRELARLWLRPC